MTLQEKKYFTELCEKRRNTADVLSDYENRGMWRSVIEKYAESAHFIYELLQTA